MFQLCHPGPTSRAGRRLMPLGQPMPGDTTDDNRILCAQCGMQGDLSRDQSGNSMDSPGLTATLTDVTVPVSATYPTGIRQVYEMVVNSGCPFCGSYNQQGFNKMKTYSARTTAFRRLK